MADVNAEDREQSIANLFSQLSRETAALVRDELQQVRDELAHQGKRVGASAGLLGAAGGLGIGAFGAITAGLVSALGRGRPGRGALLVALLYGGGATALALVARDRLSRVVPETADTVGGVQRDVQAAAEGTSRGV
jgi:putative superfamily III holin-X